METPLPDEPDRALRRLVIGASMNEWVGVLGISDDSQVVARDIEREFEARLADSSALAVRVAYSVLRHQQDAEDVAQEAFAKAHQRFSQLRDREAFRGWLVRMTWRLALDRRRGDRRREAREQVAVAQSGRDAAPGGEQAAIERERAQMLWQAIDALPEKLRVVTVLAAIEGHDVNDVSRLLGVAAGTVKSRLFQARRQLQEALQCLIR